MKNFLFLLVLISVPAFAQDFYSKIRLRDTTAATTATDGSLRVDGGISAAKTSFFADNITIKKSTGPSLVIQDSGGALGSASSPSITFKDSTTTVGQVGYVSPTTYDIQFVNLSGVGGFQWKQNSTMFAFADQNGLWQFNNGIGVNTLATTSNILNLLKTQNGTTKAILSNQSSGASAAAKYVVSSDAGDVELVANGSGNGLTGEMNVGAGFTGGFNVQMSSSNPYRIKTNGSTRVTVGGSSGEVQLEKPLVIAQSTTPSNPSSGYNKIYPKSDDKIYTLSSGGTESELLTTASGIEPRVNYLYNSNFDLWQRGTSTTVANGATAYLADRWYVENTLGASGVITYSRVTGTSDGAKYAAKLQVTTAPAVGSSNGPNFYQVLENFDSLKLYNKTVSFQAKIKAFGNVNSIVVQICYKTTEGKCNAGYSTVTASVNTASFTTVNIPSQVLSTTFTTSGSVGVYIGVNGVSSGNKSDLNNGFAVEQAMLVIGGSPSEYHSRFSSIAAELQACQRYYEKSYDMADAPGAATTTGVVRNRVPYANDSMSPVFFATNKRTTPTVTIYNPTSGSTGSYRNETAGSNGTASSEVPSWRGFSIRWQAVASGTDFVAAHFVADAEI